MKRAHVMIVEDDIALSKSLTDWLSKEYVVSSFASAEAFVLEIDQLNSIQAVPTCILLDFQLGGMTGVELQAKLMQKNISLPIVFMSGNAQQADIIDAWHGGAVDFILKPFTGSVVSATLASLFQRVEAEKALFSSPVIEDGHVDIPISQREAQVLLLLGRGLRQHEIAKMLNITLRTVKWHRASIKNKLNLNTLVELARYCDQNMRSIEKVAKL